MNRERMSLLREVLAELHAVLAADRASPVRELVARYQHELTRLEDEAARHAEKVYRATGLRRRNAASAEWFDTFRVVDQQ